MAEERLPKIALKWMPKQKTARGRPKKKWMEGIKKAMNDRNLNEGQWGDRKQWSLAVGQRSKKRFEPDIYIHTTYFYQSFAFALVNYLRRPLELHEATRVGLRVNRAIKFQSNQI